MSRLHDLYYSCLNQLPVLDALPDVYLFFSVQGPAAHVLCNCALDPKFKAYLRRLNPPAYTHIMPLLSVSNVDTREKALGALTNVSVGVAVVVFFLWCSCCGVLRVKQRTHRVKQAPSQILSVSVPLCNHPL